MEFAERVPIRDRGILEVFPPVVVFDGLDGLLLADGYHRWHAHKSLGLVEIAAEVHVGGRRDALRWSLAANATHGKRRQHGDYVHSYRIAVRNGLFDPADVEAVVTAMHCTASWAEKLTREAREAAIRVRDAAIVAGKAEGKSNRQIAAEVGLDRRTIDRFEGGANQHSDEKPHPAPGRIGRHLPCRVCGESYPVAEEIGGIWHCRVCNGHQGMDRAICANCHKGQRPPVNDQVAPPAPWKQTLADLESPKTQRWARALRALREVANLDSVEAMFAERHDKLD